MKLHELVDFRNQLKSAIDLSIIHDEILKNQERLNYISQSVNEQYKQKLNSISNDHSKIYEFARQDINKIESLLNEINNDISLLTKKFFEDNYQTECFLQNPAVLRRDKVMALADDATDILLNRIYLYSTWKYPALEIGCRDGEWTKHLVTFDPLYVADNHQEFLDNAVSQFPAEYQRRVRQYKINNFQVENLPKNQFSFIFSFNYFNYLSLDSIKQFLLQAMNWLKSGGVILFTYNNADLSASAGLTENYFMTYVPKSMLIPMAESIGFEIHECFDFLPSTSWIELKKPGNLSTVKAHQALGEIKYY